MKKDYTHITFVLDRSGSMVSIKEATIAGSNRFIEDQKKVPGMTTFTLVQFDHDYEIQHDFVELEYLPKLTSESFIPRGNTALLGAIGKAINDTGTRISLLPEDERPEMVYIVINTDGEENFSNSTFWGKEYTISKVTEMIKHQTDVYKWNFVFLGANQDAIASASNIGISNLAAINYAHSNVGTESVYAAASSGVLRSRMSKKAVDFTEEERERAR